jgi:hypothetical protein
LASNGAPESGVDVRWKVRRYKLAPPSRDASRTRDAGPFSGGVPSMTATVLRRRACGGRETLNAARSMRRAPRLLLVMLDDLG